MSSNHQQVPPAMKKPAPEHPLLQQLKGREGEAIDIDGQPSGALLRAPDGFFEKEVLVPAQLELREQADGHKSYPVIGGTLLGSSSSGVEVKTNQAAKGHTEMVVDRVIFPLDGIVTIEFPKPKT